MMEQCPSLVSELVNAQTHVSLLRCIAIKASPGLQMQAMTTFAAMVRSRKREEKNKSGGVGKIDEKREKG